MTTRFYFKNIKESDKQLLEAYFQEKKIARLEKLLLRGNLELAKFAVDAKYHERHSIFIIRLGLNFAGKDLRSEEKSHSSLLEAFDLAFDRIINQLRKVESKKHD
ncbi:MAG: HPF/RaiA family ribosome-associated protein [Candidatus Nealsonbacteria bacterium]|nr:HPF/RaiA family ribosome-associated protein [Candidatus Nealsonbacteria bacterium]